MKATFRIASGVYEYIELEGDTTDLPEMIKLQQTYSEKPMVNKLGDRVEIQAFVGGSIFYEPISHTYTNGAGDVYLSGSQYAKQFEKPFDSNLIAGKMGARAGVKPSDIQAMWKLKSEVSMGFGIAIHAALELHGRYNGLATSLEKTTHIHDHPVIKTAVEGFYAGRAQEKAEYEIFIVDHKAKRAGQVDRLLVIGDKTCRIQDFKTGSELNPEKLKIYWQQLSFYAGIMKAAGWTVEGLDIFFYDGTWHTYNKEATK